MRVLTVRNPWGTAIIHGVPAESTERGIDWKDVENRTRNIAGKYRGPLAIHIAQGWAEGWPMIWPRHRNAPTIDEALDAQRGHIIGVVDLVNVHHDQFIQGDVHCCSDSEWHGSPCPGPCSPWALPDHHHLVLSNPRPLPRPIPATGRLGLWRPDDALLTAITEQLRPGEQVTP